MYFEDYRKTIKKNIVFILTLSALGALAAFLSTSYIKSGYSIQETMFLKVDETNIQPDKNIDLQLLTDTAAALISSQNFQRPEGFIGAATTAKKIAPQIIMVSTISPEEELTKNAHKGVISKFNSTSGDFITNANVQLAPTGEAQNPTKKIFNSKILAAFGALIGFAAALTIISISKYFKI